MRQSIIWALAGIIIIIPAIVLHGYYHDRYAQSREYAVPTRIVLKLDSKIDISPIISKGTISSLGVPALDAVNSKYVISGQEYLFDSRTRQKLPNTLKSVFIVTVSEGEDIFKIISEYKQLDLVEYAHPDRQMELYETPNDPLYIVQWPLNNIGQGFPHVERHDGCGNDVQIIQTGTLDADIDAQEVFDNPPDNTRTVIVAIIDTGIDMDHPDLAARIWTNSREIPDNFQDDDHNGFVDDNHGWDFSGDDAYPPLLADNDPTDGHGHGTHCAGIVAAVSDNNEGIAGISDNCEIMALKFFPVMLSSFASSAIVYAADNGADVISMSWGYPWPVQILEDALEYARSKGVILVAASGNDEIEFSNYPASYSTVITVGATNYLDEITYFSTFGDHLNISAPGMSVLSLRADSTDMYANCEPNVHIVNGIYYLASGTSMACPHVAGVAAYLRSVSPGLTPTAAQDILQMTADDLVDPYGTGANYPGWDKYSGYGRVNLYNALASAPGLRVKIVYPQPYHILSGVIDITGIADGQDFTEYVLEYGPGNNPSSWTEITTSVTPVTDGTLGTWNTSYLNGVYTIRVRTAETNSHQVTISLANSTTADIANPSPMDTINNWISITGSAFCPDFEYYKLEYGTGSSPSTWHNILESSIPKADDQLAIWNTGENSAGIYTIRLSLFSNSGLEASDSVIVYVIQPFYGENGWRIPLGSMVSNIANYGDFDNDGQNEIIVGTSQGIKFLNPDGTPKTTGIPAIPDYDFTIPFAVGNLDNDGIDDFVAVGVAESSAKLFGFRSSGPSFEVILPAKPELILLNTDMVYNYPYVALKDIDGDGLDEIHYFIPFTCNIYNSDGSFRVAMPTPPVSRQCQYISADLDKDGSDEFYMGATMLYHADISGVVQDSFELIPPTQSGYFIRSLTAVDIDNDQKHELIAHAVDRTETGKTWIYAFDENLVLKPGWPRNTEIDNFLIPPCPIFADIDKDGSIEYFMLFFELTQTMVYAWHIDGTPYTGDSIFPIFASTPNPGRLYTGLFGDMDGDRFPDLVAHAMHDVYSTYPAQRLVAWDRNGWILNGWPLITKPSGVGNANFGVHTPAIGDINNDGYVDIVMTTGANELVFQNFEGVPYYPPDAPVPFFRYNRGINKVASIPTFMCGDANYDSEINVSDAVYIINYVFTGGAAPYPYKSSDANCDDIVNISDAVWIINYVFLSGNGPCDTDGDGLPDC